MKKTFILFLFTMLTVSIANAQRFTDNLDRGLVAVNMDGSTFLSWRILADEYFGVTYNVYRDGAKIAEGLTVSNYTDSNVGTNYTVSAVIDGVEKAQSMVIRPWTKMDTGGIKNVSSATYPGYIDIALASVKDRANNDVTTQYEANDAIFADLNGDGDLEFIIKRMNTTDAANLYPESNTTTYDVIEAYDLNYSTGVATRMWWIDVGPNMVSLNSTEINFLAYDWDEDGVAEVVLRGADNMIVHTSTGATNVIGTYGVNTRGTITHAANATFTNTGKEYLIYLNGQTGETYQVMDYPLKRIEDSEYNQWSGRYTETQMEQMAWGSGLLGHRSSKYYMGAPFLDGRKACLFLARGIYTRHKMIALDLNANHTWSTRWTWSCNDSSSDWYGQGFHNYVVADVDDDGRDEIMYGSMVIDDNGKGLHTTGFGHGDAMHVGDFDPYRQGPELYVCLEENPYWGSAYRSGTTGKIYYKYTSNPTPEQLAENPKAGDDGRCMAGNFMSDIPGGEARSVGSGLISCVKDQELFSSNSSPFEWYQCNFRLYWDGDLLDELLSNASYPNADAKLDKPGIGRLFTSTNCQLNNDSKCNACFTGDVLGDWREEILMRCGANVRLYTTTIPTTYAIPSLWFDHQYRQAMGTQMQVYNQPPHVSYFLGEEEGYTMAPPPLTTRGRTLISSGSTVTPSDNGDLLMFGYGDQSYTVSGNVSPRSIVINTPVWIQGHDNNNNIQTTVYTHTLNIGSNSTIQGNTCFVKQGLGVLNISDATLTYLGNTDIWSGTVNFNGTMQNSKVWMNRHTTLNTTGGIFNGGLTMEYGAALNIGGETSGNISTTTVSDLTLNYGARIVLDVNGMGNAEHDWLNATTLNIDDTKVGIDAWENYGPKDIVPVFKLNMTSTLDNGRYPIGNVNTVNGDLSKVKIECDVIDAKYLSLIHESGILYLQVSDVAIANEATIEITGMTPYETVRATYPSASPDNYYLPIVSIVAKNTSGQVPTLSGTFTSWDGTVTNIGSNKEVILFSEDYEHATEVSGWTHSGAPISLGSGDATHGKYFLIDLGSYSTRYAYKRISSVDVSNGCGYSIEFDLALKAGNTDPGEFCVMSKGGTNPTNYWDNYATINNNANLLFDLAGSKNSTVYNVNGTTTTTTLASETWYHITLNVNQSARTVGWQISNGSSGTFALPGGTSTEFDGFYFVTGRYNSKAMFDNIVIKSSGNDLSSFTFPELGTLQVTSDVEGYESGIKTFEVKYPYYKLFGKDFDQITSTNIAEVLGSNWNTTAQNTRWAYWSKNNSIYGENYQAYGVVNNTSPIYLCNDSDPQVVWMDSNGSYPAAVLEGFGVGRNSNGAGATIHVQNSGDSNTLIYYLVDNSRGNSPSTYGGYDKVDGDGGYTIAMDGNYTLAKLYIYVPVAIHDELATSLPQKVETQGNAHLWRNGLAGASTWATMVVPFDMTVAQVREVFGEGVTVANLEMGKGNGSQIYFETIDVATASDATTAITANKPCLMKGVTKSAPYLIMGIISEPTAEPCVTNGYFSFVGTYIDLGKIPFTTNDYFFTASGLSRVETDGTEMRLKGYRGYFQGLTANGAKSIQTVFEESGGATDIQDIPATTRNEVYDIQGRKIPDNWRLKKGVYIVNGRKVIVK